MLCFVSCFHHHHQNHHHHLIVDVTKFRASPCSCRRRRIHPRPCEPFYYIFPPAPLPVSHSVRWLFAFVMFCNRSWFQSSVHSRCHGAASSNHPIVTMKFMLSDQYIGSYHRIAVYIRARQWPPCFPPCGMAEGGARASSTATY